MHNPAVARAQPDPFEARRLRMVEQDIEARGVKDALVLKAMRKVQRHLFVEQSLWPKAYNDHPLPIGDGQTISQPYVVALMTEALALRGDGYLGWPEYAPFDAVIVTASANHIAPPLLAQLKEGGRLIIPLGGTTFYQNLTLVTKRLGKVEVKELGAVAFVPLVGEGQKK
jgi:protein-L-isoaspartate(D-aspartate) O-methyltransferase